MANITPTRTILGNADNNHGPSLLFTWAAVTEADTCLAAEVPISLPDRTFQVGGTFGSSTTVLQGSLDGVLYAGLADPGGTAISKTAAAIEAVLELTRYVKPVVSGGTSQSLTIMLLCSGPRRV